MQAEYSIAKQIGEKGFYGKVKLDATLLTNPGLLLDMDKQLYRWKPCVEWACMYFLEHASGYAGIKVSVDEIEDNPVDTSGIIIVYCVVKALEAASGCTIPDLQFDENSGKFVFGK